MAWAARLVAAGEAEVGLASRGEDRPRMRWAVAVRDEKAPATCARLPCRPQKQSEAVVVVWAGPQQA
jgi:hypothetical protein